MTRRGSVVVGLLVAALSGAITTPAYADEVAPRAERLTPEVAARHFRRGVELYDEADFATALVEFRRAYEASPDYRVLYNIGQASYQVQNYAAALAAFRRYLEEGADRVPAARRAEVERELSRLEGRVARVAVDGPAGYEVFVDQERVGRLPLAEPIVVSAGRRRISVGGPRGVIHSQALEVAGGDDVRVSVAAAPPAEGPLPARGAEGPPAPTDSNGPPSPWTPVVAMWAGTGALALGTAVTGALALSASSDLADRRERPPGTVSTRDLEDEASRARSRALVADILGGATLVAAGVSLVFTLRAHSRPNATVAVTPRSLSLGGAF